MGGNKILKVNRNREKGKATSMAMAMAIVISYSFFSSRLDSLFLSLEAVSAFTYGILAIII